MHRLPVVDSDEMLSREAKAEATAEAEAEAEDQSSSSDDPLLDTDEFHRATTTKI